MTHSPCLNCTRQHKCVGCHGKCDDYKIYRAALEVRQMNRDIICGVAAEYGRERNARALKKMWRHGEL